MTTVGMDSIIVRKENHLETPLDDEVILMHAESGVIYGLADTARDIWVALREPISFGALLDRLVEAFDVTREVCGAEVGDFLARLERAGMIEIRPRAPSAP